MHSLLKFVINRNQRTEVSLNIICYLRRHDPWNHRIVFKDVSSFLLKETTLEEQNFDQFLLIRGKNHLVSYVHHLFELKLLLPFMRDLISVWLYSGFSKIVAFSFILLHFNFVGFQELLSSSTQILVSIFVLFSFFIILLLIKSCDLIILVFDLLKPLSVLCPFFLLKLDSN